MNKVSIITSASYNAVTDKGAYGCILLTPDKDVPLDGCYIKTTAPRLELYAVVRTLEELEKIYPGENLQIELSSKLSYLTLSFSPGVLRKNLLKGESLLNYDLWKKIFDLGSKHQWRVVPIKQNAVERYHAMAQKVAIGSTTHFDGIEDPGVNFSSKKRKPKALPLFEDESQTNETKFEEQNTMQEQPSRRDDMPIIENNDPPF